MTASRGLAYLESLAQWNGRSGFGLEGVRAILERLGNPQDRYRTIHIAGTNGKGSVAAFCTAILVQAGIQVGTTISPHLVAQNERISVNGCPISDEELDLAASDVALASEELQIALSYFEAITVSAFLVFQRREVEVAVVEVGLGGRLDATNALSRPAVAVITSIGLDHTTILGNSVEAIAREKAGIIKGGHPTVLGWLPDEASNAIREISGTKTSEIICAGRDFLLSDTSIEVKGEVFTLPQLALPGEHQLRNGAVAMIACHQLGVSWADCLSGLRRARWPGRLERVTKKRSWILDAAHNPEGAGVLAVYLRDRLEKGSGPDPEIVFGALNDKNWREMVDALAPIRARWSVTTAPSPRAVRADEIAAYLTCIGIKDVRCIELPRDIDLLDDGVEESPVIVTGSMFLVGVARAALLGAVARYVV